MIIPLDIVPSQRSAAARMHTAPLEDLPAKPYSPERQRDWVRLIVTCGLLLILGYLVVFATVESTSYPVHWAQTKEMLQIILPALTGIIGTVIGFYFGTAAASQAGSQDD
ncbi:MAG TPA: hypothetical protein VKV02_09615 [Acidobacteriaceae bacterium]|nr:hypothetical protein [Acidobacteriaceae bacterium]